MINNHVFVDRSWLHLMFTLNDIYLIIKTLQKKQFFSEMGKF